MNQVTGQLSTHTAVVAIGKESVGKSQLIASIRKDGILLFTEPNVVGALTPLQILTAVYLAGVILPCLVTLLTIVREVSWRFALKLLSQQVVAGSKAFRCFWLGAAPYLSIQLTASSIEAKE